MISFGGIELMVLSQGEQEAYLKKVAKKCELVLEIVDKPKLNIHDNIFDSIIETLSKEVKNEKDNLIQVALTIFSAYTKTPQNLRILAPSSEGKTYIVTKVSNLFPQENIITLANATPQAFKYRAAKDIVELTPGFWVDLPQVLAKEGLDNLDFKDLSPEQKIRLKEIKEKTYSLVDFTNKTIIFLDNQSFALWEAIKTTLSHDKEYSKYLATNKSKAGQTTTNNIVFKGWPAVIYCSAKDEIDQDKTDEINTRFNTISIKGDNEKYKTILNFKAINAHLPDHIYQQKIISDLEVELLRKKIGVVIEQIQKYAKINKPIMNFYAEEIAARFQNDAGFRVRQLGNLLSNITVITLANAHTRPKIIIGGNEYPITIKSDIELAAGLAHELNPLPPTKLQFFNKYIRTALLEQVPQNFPLTALEICQKIQTKHKETTPRIDRQSLREKYLDGLVNHGFLDYEEDPANASRYRFKLTEHYISNQAALDTSLLVTTSLDDSCVNIFKEKWLSDVPDWKIIDVSENEILSSDQDVKDDIAYEKNQLIILLSSHVTQPPKNMPNLPVKQVTDSDVKSNQRTASQ